MATTLHPANAADTVGDNSGAAARAGPAPKATGAQPGQGNPGRGADAETPGRVANPAPADQTALVHVPDAETTPVGEMSIAPVFARMPVELDVGVPVRNFRVRDLLSLEAGRLIESQWNHGEDVPLAAGDVQLAWSEFEVIDAQLAVRVTRLL